MKNKEFYKEEIFEIACEYSKVAIVNGKPSPCNDNSACEECEFYYSAVDCKELLKEWLEKEYEEPRIQPEVKKLKKDDRVLVSNDGKIWRRRYFEKYDSNQELVYTYNDGTTSWSSNYDGSWKYAKLPEDIKKEIDWANIPVDTKIFVRDNGSEEWESRYFAKYKNGKVYAWINGCTSDQTDDCVWWLHAKLAEGDWIGEIVKK